MGTRENMHSMKNEMVKLLFDRRVILSLASLVIAAMILIACNSFIVSASSKTKPQTYKYYTEVRIGHNDTLWGIANEYITDDYDSVNSYINEVLNINSMLTEDVHYGQRIVVPYYSAELKQ